MIFGDDNEIAWRHYFEPGENTFTAAPRLIEGLLRL